MQWCFVRIKKILNKLVWQIIKCYIVAQTYWRREKVYSSQEIGRKHFINYFHYKNSPEMRRDMPKDGKDYVCEPIPNITLNGKNWKHFPSDLDKRQVRPLSPVLLDIVLKVLARAIQEENEINGKKLDKRKTKYPNWQTELSKPI